MTVPFVADDPIRTPRRDGLHQLPEVRDLVPLAGSNQEGEGFSAALCPEVDLRPEAATAPAQGLAFLPSFAPAACWWARRFVLSTC